MATAWKVRGLTSRSSFRDAAGRIILTRWREMMSYRDGTLLGEDIEELHAMRVSSRRLRSAMDAFAETFPNKSFRRNLRMVKRITDTLGDARDLDVTIEHLEELIPDLAEVDQPGLHGLIARYRDERQFETQHIAALFEELERTAFAPQFERWIKRHTGIDVDELKPRPPKPEHTATDTKPKKSKKKKTATSAKKDRSPSAKKDRVRTTKKGARPTKATTADEASRPTKAARKTKKSDDKAKTSSPAKKRGTRAPKATPSTEKGP